MSKRMSVLLVGSGPGEADAWSRRLGSSRREVELTPVADETAARAALAGNGFDAVLSVGGGPLAHAVLRAARETRPGIAFVAVTPAGDVSEAVALMRQGADDCLPADRLQGLGAALLRAGPAETRRAALEGNERFRRIIDVTPVPVGMNDAAGNITYVNPRFTQTFGYTLQDMPHLDQWWPRAYPDPEYRAYVMREWWQRLQRMVDTGRPFEAMEIDIRCKNGSARTVLAEAAPLGPSFEGQHLVILYDITERKRAELALAQSEAHHRRAAEANRRLVQEVNHRVRNNLASLLSLIAVMRRRADSLPTFAAAVEDRVRNLARIHNLLAASAWDGLTLDSLISNLLAPTDHDAPGRLHVEGPRVFLPSAQVLPLASTIVELAGNSQHHGSLSVPGGRLHVTWNASPADPGPGTRVTLRWHESGGPPVNPAPRRSIGTELIEGFVTHDLSGKCSLRFLPEGVDHLIEFTVA